MRPLAAIALFVLSGCTGNSNYSYSGFSMTEYFEFDGERTWEFVSQDTDLAYLLIGDLLQETGEANNGDSIVYTIEFTKDCVGTDATCVDKEFVRSVDWSCDDTHGTQIHHYLMADGDEKTFDPPLGITDAKMKKEDYVETAVDGTTWRSTFVSIEECPVQWNVDWNECIRLEVDDGVGDLTTGSPVSGIYWVITGFNVVAMELPGETDRWELLKHHYTPD